MDFKNVGVVGCGTMGSGICEVAARAGYSVTFLEVDEERVKAGIERIESSLGRAVAGEKIGADERDEFLSKITGSTRLEDLSGADVVIEAIPEHLDLKRHVFADLDRALKPEAIIATNTSSLPVIELGVATDRPHRVIGIHFFNPAPVMELVELVQTVTTDEEAMDAARSFVESLGKTPVQCRDRAGFIANLLLFPYLNEAVKLLEAGFASREDIDAAMRFGAAHPMGPLQLLDLVGLDSCSEILESLYRQFADQRYAPSPAFRHLVTAGYLGRKSGKGFYTYTEPDSPEVMEDGRSGRVIPLPEAKIEVGTVGVVGTGTMGAGIVEVASRAGLEVVCRGRSDDSLAKASASVERSTGKALEKGKLTEADREALLGRITWSTEFDALANCDLVIEAVAEDLDLKRSLFSDIDKVAKDGSILATGTSSLPVVEVAAATSRPESVLGIHFFNPAGLMRLVELVRTVATSTQVLADAKGAVEKMGKHAVLCEDRAGFIVNRLLFPYLNDAIKMLESGYAAAEDIDTAMKLGCRHPMGPLELIDLVGLDVTHEILKSLHAEFREPTFAPAPYLAHMVKAGYLGRKTKRGFYPY
jgi:3-hydroxybutyryl-CoA dehydrogenase